MGKTWIAAMAAALCLVGCTHPAGKTDPQLRAIEDSITAGNYDAAVSQTRAVEAQSPAPSCAPQALYLEGYAMAYGWGDYRRARKPLEQLLDAAPAEPLASKALRLLADCDYWQGYYARAIREYQKLSSSPDPETRDYAGLQGASCLLLRRQVGDAITAYRSLVSGEPGRAAADQAQLMIANIYLSIQNPSQAKTELQKLLAMTKNQAYAEAARTALKQIEVEAPFHQGPGGSR